MTTILSSLTRTRAGKFLMSGAFAFLIGSPGLCSELSDLIDFTPPPTQAIVSGDSVLGNSFEAYTGYTNISQTNIVLHGINEVLILDPEDIGFPDVNSSNVNDVFAAFEAQHPTFDIFYARYSLSFDPPKKNWTSVSLAFDSNPLPLTLQNGDSFEFTINGQNDTLGPDFGPTEASFLTTAQIFAIGELVVGIDLDYQLVPEPSAMGLCCVGVLLMSSRQRRNRAAHF